MPTETPPAQPSARDELFAKLEAGFAARAAGKTSLDEPPPAETPPAPTETKPESKPSDSPPASGGTAKPNPVAARPSPVAAEVEAKRTATAQQWKEVNEERDRLRTQLKELEAERAKWGQAEKTTEEVTQLKAKLTEYDTLLRQVAAERHPDLIGPINQKVDAAVKLARSAVPKDQADAVARLLTMPDSEDRDGQLDAVLESLSTTKRARLIKAMTDVEEANGQRAALAEHSQQVLSAREQARQKQHQEALGMYDVEAADWTDPQHGIELLMDKPGDKEHNERRNAILENGRALYSGQVSSPRDLARAAIWSALAPELVTQNQALKKALAERDEVITKLKTGAPGLGSAGQTTPEADPDEKPKDMPLSKWIALKAERAGVQWGRL